MTQNSSIRAYLGLKERVTVAVGHFGAGKTNFAVNLALALERDGEKTALADMDIVNPYFRAADNKAALEMAGVKCILPYYANSNVDIPALPPELYSLFADRTVSAVLDVGGDDSGAAALGMFAKYIYDAGYDMPFVVNMYRPLIASPSDAVEVMREIEERARLRCTAIINNSNLGGETTERDIAASFAYADEISALAGLPLLCDCAAVSIKAEGRKIFAIKDITQHIWEDFNKNEQGQL